MIVQIAGIIDEAEARLCVEAGVDELAFPLGPGIRTRDVEESEAARIVRGLPVSAVLITYLTEATAIAELCRRLGFRKVQLHGPVPESEVVRLRGLAPELFIIVSLIVGAGEALEERVVALSPFADAFLTDTFHAGARGATGKTHDWAVSRRLVQLSPRPVILAGGLRPENVRAAIAAVGPAGVDAHTGVEGADGRKERERLRRFIAEARA